MYTAIIGKSLLPKISRALHTAHIQNSLFDLVTITIDSSEDLIMFKLLVDPGDIIFEYTTGPISKNDLHLWCDDPSH